MDEYIKREAVKKLININFSGLLAAIDTIPAADVGPVVRCENCAFSQSNGWVCGGTVLMPPHQTFPDSFCECGKEADNG